jgi:protein-S-isoprenylcysteine O-methyltransferase Ste14
VNPSLLWEILLWSWFVSEVLIGIATRTRQDTGRVRDRGTLILLWAVIFTSISACRWIGNSSVPNMFGGGLWLKTVSDGLMLFGVAVRWTAILTLGKSFSSNVAIRDLQTMQRSGLYSLVRHPSYLGLLLILLALGVHSRNWFALAVVLLPSIAALLYRIHVEELALRDAFGADCTDYCKSTKRLIPGIY